MWSLLKIAWSLINGEEQNRESQKRYEEERLRLEAVLYQQDEQPKLATKWSKHTDFGGVTNFPPNKSNSNENINKSNCFQKTGVITFLQSNHGMIDGRLLFDMNDAITVSGDLQVGCNVKYLAFQRPNSDFTKVMKIEQVMDETWDIKDANEKIQKPVSDLQIEDPTYFSTHQRTIMGIILERNPESILIEIDNYKMDLDLGEIEIDFIPKEGDRIFAICTVQSDELFVDSQGEILDVVSIHPARILKQEKCEVREVYSDWGQLNEDAYYKFDISPMARNLNVGDWVYADLIECEIRHNSKYVWRCIQLSLFNSTTHAQAPHVLSPVAKVSSKNIYQTVTVSNDVNCFFATLFEKQVAKFKIKNNSERQVIVKSVEISKRHETGLRLVEPKEIGGILFTLQKNESRVLCFEVQSKTYGDTRERFVICTEKFRVRRCVHVVVSDSKESMKSIEATYSEINKENIKQNKTERTDRFQARNSTHRSRHYANEIWSKKSDVIPGVSFLPTRRFIANRIGSHDVPERMRNAYLLATVKSDMINEIDAMFPSLKEELNITNYSKRFQALLHLEEIEYFVHFRKYDQERAHFTRDGEFLSLTIEDLAERRPSLVIGDTVRASDPWSASAQCNLSFDGVIHKVLFNRVLLKFNSGFQSKYNGEDFRLEFYFSRYGFRKQHYAINRIVNQLGENFLFPSRIKLREKMQLDVKLDEDSNLSVSNKKFPWHNQSLNTVQKQAVCNILRGETQNMAYVIWGPPGTGKTITLVETILQLVKLLPSARLLVGAPSNSSADLLATRIINSGVLQPGDFVRLVSQNQVEKDLIPDHLMAYCATVDIGIEGACSDSMIITDSGLKLRCKMKHLGRNRVTISTCSTLGNFLQMSFPKEHFTHVLIDESGQCSEPEVMVAISQVSQTRGQVILAGDPNQLPAVVTNRFSSERGLSTSLLERILHRTPYSKDIDRFPDTYGYDRRLVTKLIYNYRALPSILNVYNSLFYDSELVAKVKENGSREANLLTALKKMLPKTKRPISHGAFFYGVRSENKQENDSPSWFNPIEAKNVFLMTIHLYREHIQPKSIGIITPYQKQVKHIRNLFITADLEMPKIGSVEEFQGQERDIILISTVRSSKNCVASDLRHSLGFVQCPKRMNVAISRARYLIFVFGNPHLLKFDKCWRSYIEYCAKNGAYLGCDLPEDMDAIEYTEFTDAD